MATTASAPQFVVFSDDWGEHMSSCQHLFKIISKQHKVIWVNTIGMRNPTLTLGDLRKALKKLSKMFGAEAHGTRSDDDAGNNAVVVRQPLMLPFSNLCLVRRFNAWSVRRSIRRARAHYDIKTPVVLTTVPNACDFLDDLDAALIVYYCVDDFAEWPGLQKDLVRKMETELVKRADVLVATSHKLLEKLRATGKPTHLLTHGVDIELFSQDAPAEHPSLANIPEPRVGYFGLFDDRSDQRLLAEVAERMPDNSFVIAGPVETVDGALECLENVWFIGRVQYEDLPAFVRGMVALFIPYKINQLSEYLSPLKLREYIVTGKPVISTPIPDVYQMGDHVTIAQTPDEWEVALRGVRSRSLRSSRAEISAAMASESWTAKAAKLLQICRKALAETKELPQ